jgi:predicted O-methyltransferase YrrM
VRDAPPAAEGSRAAVRPRRLDDRLKDLAGRALAPWLAARLRAGSRRAGDSPRAQVDFVLGTRTGLLGIHPLQVAEELAGLLERLTAERPRRLLEIGTARGGTLFALCRAAGPDALLVSLDLPWGSGGGYRPWREALYARFGRERQRVVLLRGDSGDPAIRDRVVETLGGDRLDFLLIDGDHSYEGARRDWETYAPLVRPGGLIAFHDIVPGPEKLVGGVPELWREIAAGRATETLVHDWDQKGCGIGLVRA